MNKDFTRWVETKSGFSLMCNLNSGDLYIRTPQGKDTRKSTLAAVRKAVKRAKEGKRDLVRPIEGWYHFVPTDDLQKVVQYLTSKRVRFFNRKLK